MVQLTDEQYELLMAAVDALIDTDTYRICTNCHKAFIRNGQICPKCGHDPSYDIRKGKTIEELVDEGIL